MDLFTLTILVFYYIGRFYIDLLIYKKNLQDFSKLLNLHEIAKFP